MKVRDAVQWIPDETLTLYYILSKAQVALNHSDIFMVLVLGEVLRQYTIDLNVFL